MLCSPSRGGIRRIEPGVFEKPVGIPANRSGPSVGCSMWCQKPEDSSWGSSIRSSSVFTLIDGTLSASSSSHSAVVRVSAITPTSRYTSSMLSSRDERLAKRASSASSGRPASVQNTRH